ncbi:patatin-like phospholipase family protein [Archangium gephyra]|uniref:patatin-like phospholipase family protein n=1 Tax=Archangium gephyra TaxID=48 RepID=UPI0035D52545
MDEQQISMRMLSCDAGPPALIAVRVLKALEKEVPGFLHKVDLFAGTSAGALLNTWLAARLPSPSEPPPSAFAMEELLDKCIEFVDASVANYQAGLVGWARFLTGILSIKSGHGLRQSLESNFGSKRLGQLERRVLVTSFDMVKSKPKLFTNLPHLNGSDQDTRLSDIMRATSAFPMDMPLFGMKDAQYLDGFLAASNPSITALGCASWSLRMAAEQKTPENPHAGHGSRFMPTFRMLSFGITESSPDAFNVKWGLLAPFAKLIEPLVDWMEKHNIDFPHFPQWGVVQWELLRPFLLPFLMISGPSQQTTSNVEFLMSEGTFRRCSPLAPMEAMFQQAVFGLDTKQLIDISKKCADDYINDKNENEKFSSLVQWAKNHWFEEDHQCWGSAFPGCHVQPGEDAGPQLAAVGIRKS